MLSGKSLKWIGMLSARGRNGLRGSLPGTFQLCMSHMALLHNKKCRHEINTNAFDTTRFPRRNNETIHLHPHQPHRTRLSSRSHIVDLFSRIERITYPFSAPKRWRVRCSGSRGGCKRWSSWCRPPLFSVKSLRFGITQSTQWKLFGQQRQYCFQSRKVWSLGPLFYRHRKWTDAT